MIFKIFEEGSVRQGKVGGMEKGKRRGCTSLPFLWYRFADPWPHLFLAVVTVLAAPYPSCGIQPLMSHSCLLRLQGVHHTRSCTSHASPTGSVCFLLRFSLCFPLYAQRRMSSTLVLPDWHFLSMFQWISQNHSDSEKTVSWINSSVIYLDDK